ncbi:MAG: phosphoenolpyruvate--protein phosphotransferase [Holophagales bacterium]|nr:MAG: phosphoenolpyruvate--protein phosphotransferase [Holophagales bacterium]
MSESRKATRVFSGLAVSEGVAIGHAVSILSRTVDIVRFPLQDDAIEGELSRFREAVAGTHDTIEATHGKAGEFLGDELAAIFTAHALLLADPSFVGFIEQRIRQERVNAEWAVHQTSTELISRFERMEDPYLRERSHDVEDVSRQLLRTLQGVGHHELSELQGDVIVVADDLTPSEAIRLGRGRVVGFAVESGGLTSHTSIIARSLHLPAVCGLAGVTGLVTTDDPVVLDGSAGSLILHPGDETLERYRQVQREQEECDLASEVDSQQPCVTADGVAIELMANIDLPEEIEAITRFGARGIGLYRSEFLFMETEPSLPTEEQHYQAYRQLAEGASPFPAVIRTYDLGGRKLARDMMHLDEENPVLGLRGIRLTLARPVIFRTQLRGILRASAHGEVWLMAPLVSRLEELRQFRGLVEELAGELRAEGREVARDLKVGIMIEVPAATLIADALARESDFFSIGTNDLIQYSLAVDRNNRHVSELYQPLHPALLRMIRMTVRAANAAGIPASLCGEMAGDPRFLPLLIGLGLRRLSLNPRTVPALRRLVRELDVRELERCAERCLDLGTAAEVERELSRVRRTPSASRPVDS